MLFVIIFSFLFYISNLHLFKLTKNIFFYIFVLFNNNNADTSSNFNDCSLTVVR